MSEAVARLATLVLLGLLAGPPPASAQGAGGGPGRPASAARDGKAAGKPAQPPAAQVYAQRFAAECATCHGATGRGEQAAIPVLAGQHAFYSITQLFLFREGRRGNEAMTAVAKGMKDDDLRGFSDHIGTLPAVPPPSGPLPDPARMARGRALAEQHRCLFCHGADLAGGQQVPRIGGQHEEYLRLTLHEFKSGKRPGYSQAMFDPVSRMSGDELDAVAYYVARSVGSK